MPSKEEEEATEQKYLRLFFFGHAINMKGAVKIERSSLPEVNEYFRNHVVNGTMCGSVAVARKDLFYQHVVIDFDLKGLKEPQQQVVLSQRGLEEFVQFRFTSVEKHILEDANVSLDNCELKVENFVYEIIHILRHILRLNWLPIYILVKQRDGEFFPLSSGFHIEIPNLIMAYHDIAILDSVLRRYVPNHKLLDSPHNYSLFGSQKYPNCTYLPYYVIDPHGQFFPLEKTTQSPADFNFFNLTKTLAPETKIYGFRITHNCFAIPLPGYSEEDTTIPEYKRRKQPEESVSSFPHPDENFFVKIGYVYYNGQKADKTLSVYKRVLLNPEEDFTLYRNLNSSNLNLAHVIPNNNNNNQQITATRAFAKRNKMKMYIFSSPQYKEVSKEWINVNFTNKKIPLSIIDFERKEEEEEAEEEETKNPFHPFQLEHILHLSEMNARMRDTVYFLVAFYFLAETTHSDALSRLSKEWYNLLVDFKKKRFTRIYWDLKEKNKRGILPFDTHQQRWAILSLKILIVANDVVKNNAGSAAAYEKFKYVHTASGYIKIPDIILWCLFNEYPYHNHNEDFYEIMALFVPFFRHKDVVHLWDSRNSRWKMCPNAASSSTSTSNPNVAVKHVTDIYPELNHMFTVIIPYVHTLKKKEELEEKKKEEEEEKEDKKKQPLTLHSLMGRIQGFWSAGGLLDCPAPVPNVFFCLADCWYVLGGGQQAENQSNNNNNNNQNSTIHDNENIHAASRDSIYPPSNDLIAIHPVAAYRLDSSFSPVKVDSYRIEELYSHMDDCPFVQHQLFPLVRQILQQDHDQRVRRDSLAVEAMSDLRRDVENRTVFQKSFDDDPNLQIDLEVNTNFTSDQVRTPLPCGNKKNKTENLSRDEYAVQLAETFWRRNTTRELAKLVKWHVLKKVAHSYKLMAMIVDKNAAASASLLDEYSHQTPQQRRIHAPRRMLALARIMRQSVKNHPDMSHQLSRDMLEADEMTPLRCNCAVTHAFMYLLQTFSYDIASLRYVLGNCLLPAICYGAQLKSKQIHFFLGNTNCGKTDFLNNVLLSIFGHVAGILSSHTAHQGSSQDRIHDLGKWGETARFWFMDEITRKPLNRQLVNQITGNSPLFLRTNYSQGQMIQVAPSIFVFGNNKPTFNENCPALLSRCVYFIFRSQFHRGVGGEPFSFKYCKFPQTDRDDIVAGLLALIFHATCYTRRYSPFYLYDVLTVVDVPRNVLDATLMYSPVMDIVKKLCVLCRVREEPLGMIPVRRFGYLITHLKHILKCTNIASESDALNFISQVYVVSKLEIENEAITIFQGITETSVYENDQRIAENVDG